MNEKRDKGVPGLCDLGVLGAIESDSGEDLSPARAQRSPSNVMTENEIGRLVVDAAITVHRELGPGLLENSLRGHLGAPLAGTRASCGAAGADTDRVSRDKVR